MKKILIISSSMRKNSNSDIIAREFERGVKAAGHDTEYMSLRKKEINFCIGCFACLKTEKCFMADYASAIIEKMRYADVVVFATPVYSNQMCGQLKTLLDRTNPIFPVEYAFREVYLITTATIDDESVPDGVTAGINGWIDCFPKARLKGVIKGVGIDKAGEAKSRAAILEQAYEMGRGV